MKSIDERMNYLIIDDILIEILFNLNVKQLLQLERVSKQFEYCINFVLKRQKVLYIWTFWEFIICNFLKKYKTIFRGNNFEFSTDKGGVSEWVAGFKSSITPLVFKQFFQIFYIK
jgi:hypothetical protein